MPFSHILIVYLVSTLIVFLPSFGFAKLFPKAGIESWKAYVPFYNTWEMQKAVKRPRPWVFWQFIPVVGWLTYCCCTCSPGLFSLPRLQTGSEIYRTGRSKKIQEKRLEGMGRRCNFCSCCCHTYPYVYFWSLYDPISFNGKNIVGPGLSFCK